MVMICWWKKQKLRFQEKCKGTVMQVFGILGPYILSFLIYLEMVLKCTSVDTYSDFTVCHCDLLCRLFSCLLLFQWMTWILVTLLQSQIDKVCSSLQKAACILIHLKFINSLKNAKEKKKKFVVTHFLCVHRGVI